MFVRHESFYPETDAENKKLFAISANDFPTFNSIKNRWLYYRVNAIKIEYFPHQNRSIANPVPSYSTFPVQNITTAQPPITVLFTSSEKALDAKQIGDSPSSKTFMQGNYWKMYRKIKLPLIVGAQGNTGIDVKMPSRRTLVSTEDSNIKWGSIYTNILDVDQDFTDNNDRQPMSYTHKFTLYVTFVKAASVE